MFAHAPNIPGVANSTLVSAILFCQRIQELDIPELGQILIGTSITFYGSCSPATNNIVSFPIFMCERDFYGIKNVPYNSPAFDTNYLLKHVYKIFFLFHFSCDILYNFNLAELITPDRIYCPPSNVSRR